VEIKANIYKLRKKEENNEGIAEGFSYLKNSRFAMIRLFK